MFFSQAIDVRYHLLLTEEGSSKIQSGGERGGAWAERLIEEGSFKSKALMRGVVGGLGSRTEPHAQREASKGSFATGGLQSGDAC